MIKDSPIDRAVSWNKKRLDQIVKALNAPLVTTQERNMLKAETEKLNRSTFNLMQSANGKR